MIQLGDFEYDPRNHLGRGQFGSVYRGNFIVALRHPNIVKLYAYYIDEKRTGIYLIMEMCNGGDLSKYLAAKRPLSLNSIRIILGQVARAMNEMFILKVIHRDLKPANILLSHCKNCGKQAIDLPIEEITFKIGDFGLARELKRNEMAATVCGSPVYMAPEVHLMKPYDSKADVWSLGAIIYECLTGKVPYNAESLMAMIEMFKNHPGRKPMIPSGTDPALSNLIISMLAFNPEDRPDFGEEEAAVVPQPRREKIKHSASVDVVQKVVQRSRNEAQDARVYRDMNRMQVSDVGFATDPHPGVPVRMRSSSLGRYKAKPQGQWQHIIVTSPNSVERKQKGVWHSKDDAFDVRMHREPKGMQVSDIGFRDLVQPGPPPRRLPRQWKDAAIVPLAKCEDQCNSGNYRPVSLNGVLGKLAERLVAV
ncbi:unnamed protein product [Echinostoma caproni]|uniref:Protein kinase domain-containing protein n=1 Tax=Echinostoma caproni TaxID=27848 RepID=A0A183APE2_9TREM|nr:unnamed protein product [Echinostoma caproni]